MKIAIIGDVHFGVSDQDSLDNQIKFFTDQLVPHCKQNQIDTLVFEGDIFHNRKTIDILVKNKVLDLFRVTLKDFKCLMYLGNHDVYYKNTNSVHSLKILMGLPNVTVYEEITNIKLGGRNLLIVPWLFEYKTLTDFKVDPKTIDITFGHFDVIGAKMNAHKYSDVGLAKDVIFRFPLVFSGHYHTHSIEEHSNGILIYTGTPYQLDRGDRKDTKGFYVVDLDDLTREFIENKVSARFIEVHYPEISEDIKGNKVDVYVEEKDMDSFEFKKYLEDINLGNPLSVVTKVIDKELGVTGADDIEVDSKSLEEIFIEYVNSLKYDEGTKENIVSLAKSLMRGDVDE